MAEDNNENIGANGEASEESIHEVTHVDGMYKSWFLDYSSYVILERAVPSISDGFKPVQRRIMHAMREMDDGRYNKVANIIGQTMQYHPHGDASIADAIVNLGQKDILIDTQGNWGDVRTGDRAAAPRYIEARPSKFALDVLYNPQTTAWQLSYDGRKKEPVNLPVKFPLLLAQGVEGIAVGLSTKILPHNFVELIDASVDILRNKQVSVLPDFPTGGLADFSEYNQGQRGGKVRIRARIEEFDKRTLLIKDIPYGTTTSNLIDSIIKANDKGKIKIKKVVDNTAEHVEIEVQIAAGQSPDVVIDALYAFTDCELSISPNACVIVEDKPRFMGVNEILRYNTQQTVALLTREQEIRRDELLEKILFSSLEKIFIENRIYRDIEEATTWEEVLRFIDQGLDPFKKDFYREITEDDLVKLTEIKIKRISKFDGFKADELMRRLEEELAETEHNLANIVDFTIAYYKNLKKKYGAGRERRTEIRSFDTIQAAQVAASNVKLYVNREEGFIGYSLKKDEYVCDCSDLDDIIVFRRDGKYVVTKIQDKTFVGKNIIHVGVFRKGDERMVYNAIYLDGKTGRAMAKRFQVPGVTRDREYDVTKGAKNSKVLYFTANPNGEAEIVTVNLTASSRAKIKVFDFDFASQDIKGKTAGGNILTRYPVRKVQLKREGASTLGGLEIHYDEAVGKLNSEGRGKFIGSFFGDDRILVAYKNGTYKLTNYELSNRYEPEQVIYIQKFDPEATVSAVYYDGASKTHFIKRFKIETSTQDKPFSFITEHRSSQALVVTTDDQPQIEVDYQDDASKKKATNLIDVDVLGEVRGWRALGNKLNLDKIKAVRLIESPKDTSREQMDLF